MDAVIKGIVALLVIVLLVVLPPVIGMKRERERRQREKAGHLKQPA